MAEPTKAPRKTSKRIYVWLALLVVALIVLLFLM